MLGWARMTRAERRYILYYVKYYIYKNTSIEADIMGETSPIID